MWEWLGEGAAGSKRAYYTHTIRTSGRTYVGHEVVAVGVDDRAEEGVKDEEGHGGDVEERLLAQRVGELGVEHHEERRGRQDAVHLCCKCCGGWWMG